MQILAGVGASAILGDFDSIATTTLSTATATITFSSIPATYKHLQLRCSLQSSTANNTDLQIRMNSDTGANYSRHSIRGDGATALADAFSHASQTLMWLDRVVCTTSQIFSGVVIDLLDYANASKYKTMRGFGGADRNGAGLISLSSGSWQNTAAITTLTFTLSSGNFTQYSTIALYGIKG